MRFAPQRRALFLYFFYISTSKSGANMWCFNILARNALRATTACTFSTCLSTSKSGPSMVCFVHFALEMRFVPQRRALFRHVNFQKWSEHGVFCACWLGNVLRATRCALFRQLNFQKCPECEVFFSFANVLRATTTCNFSFLIWPDGSAPAALASLLVDPPEPQIIGKTQCFRDFPTFSRACIFFLPTLSLFWSSLFCSSLLWLFPPLLFHLSILSEVSLLNFLR